MPQCFPLSAAGCMAALAECFSTLGVENGLHKQDVRKRRA